MNVSVAAYKSCKNTYYFLEEPKLCFTKPLKKSRVKLIINKYSKHITTLIPVLVMAVTLLTVSNINAYNNNKMMTAATALGPRAQKNAESLSQLIAQGSQSTDDSRVRGTNKFFNDAVQFADDIEIWGVSDYWASPLEMLAKGAGDCEDFAIAKYFSLLAMGMPQSKLRMVYVRAMIDGPETKGQAHMVVAYYPTPDADPLILDNLVYDVRPASLRKDLVPIFSFNSEGLWQGMTNQPNGDAITRLSKWREILHKTKNEGF